MITDSGVGPTAVTAAAEATGHEPEMPLLRDAVPVLHRLWVQRVDGWMELVRDLPELSPGDGRVRIRGVVEALRWELSPYLLVEDRLLEDVPGGGPAKWIEHDALVSNVRRKETLAERDELDVTATQWVLAALIDLLRDHLRHEHEVRLVP